jgi:hypothetical protein
MMPRRQASFLKKTIRGEVVVFFCSTCFSPFTKFFGKPHIFFSQGLPLVEKIFIESNYQIRLVHPSSTWFRRLNASLALENIGRHVAARVFRR